NELWNNFSVGEHIGHPEIFYFHQQPTGKISRPGDFIDECERHSKISRFQGRTSRGHNSNTSALHDFGGLIDFDFESATPASEFLPLRLELSPHPPLSPRGGERIKVRGR